MTGIEPAAFNLESRKNGPKTASCMKESRLKCSNCCGVNGTVFTRVLEAGHQQDMYTGWAFAKTNNSEIHSPLEDGSMKFAIATLFVSACASADILVVPNQYLTIQEAINASQSGDEILVQPGTYQESLTITDKLIKIVGLGGASGTIIDGSLTPDESTVRWTNCSGNTVGIDGFTLRNGNRAITATDSQPELTNLVLESNGNRICSFQDCPDLRMINCQLNCVDSIEYGVEANVSPLEMIECRIAGCIGDGIRISDSQANVFTNVIITGCRYGIRTSRSSLQIDQCEFSDGSYGLVSGAGNNQILVNQSKFSFFSERAVFLSDSADTRVFSSCVFSENGPEGAMFLTGNGSNNEVSNCEFRFNSSSQNAGAIQHGSSSERLTISSTVFCGNTNPQIGGSWTNGGGNTISDACQPVGACCFGGTCRVLSIPACEIAGGDFAGEDTECTGAGCDTCESDFDNDGSVGLTDLIRLLSNWGPC